MFTEAEIQLLIASIELAQPVETPNNNHYRFYPRSMAEAAAYFRGLLVDWEPAYPGLVQKGLLARLGDSWQLTAQGAAEAVRLRNERPPIYYWYEEFYTLAPVSPAYSEFCIRLYGLDLCQAGFSDLAQIDALLAAAGLDPGQRALELGCGAGRVAEYISEHSGAEVLGLDYSPAAVAGALARTASKRSRLSYQVGNLDGLEFPPASFDLIYSIDSLYMPADLDATLARLVGMLKPGGRLLAFYMHFVWEAGADRLALLPQNTPLGLALGRAGLKFGAQDFSEVTWRLMQAKHSLGEHMRLRFAAEGSQMLADFILAESESSSAPYDPQTCPFTRYLYRASIQ